jgi:hypothetical protein
MIKNFKWLLFASLAFIAWYEEEVAVDATSSDGKPWLQVPQLSNTWHLESYAAGFSDNALFIEGQKVLMQILFRNSLL